MSDTKYAWNDWRSYVVHNDKVVRGFFGDYRFLSNFENAPIPYDGLVYPSVEHAYQAAKVTHVHRAKFLTCTAAESKKLWKECDLLDKTPADWDARKLRVMTECLFQKFLHHTNLREKLLATGDKYLEETNHWGDVIWGVDVKKGGENWLGLLLMKLRTFFAPASDSSVLVKEADKLAHEAHCLCEHVVNFELIPDDCDGIKDIKEALHNYTTVRNFNV